MRSSSITLVAVLVLAACSMQVMAASCPDLSKFRSPYIQQSLDLQKLSGLWFEVAYEDLAQVGESCQIYNNSIKGNDIYQNFKVEYGSLPFTLSLLYNSTNITGLFQRSAFGATFAEFPSVIVDVTLDANGNYESLTEYLCVTIAGIEYVEVRFGYRQPAIDPTLMSALQNKAQSLGVTWSSLTYVDHSKCTNASH